jgi:excisionase family DNA binding protein
MIPLIMNTESSDETLNGLPIVHLEGCVLVQRADLERFVADRVTQVQIEAARSRTECLLNVKQVARRLSLAPSSVYELIARGQLQAVRVGRAVRVRPADLDAYLEKAISRI